MKSRIIYYMFYIIVLSSTWNNLQSQVLVGDISESLAHININPLSYRFSSNGAFKEPIWDFKYHIQGIAYYDGYYYIVRSRPEYANFQQLIIVSKENSCIVYAGMLDSEYDHPGGIQIYDGILVVPFNGKLKLYKINFQEHSGNLVENPPLPILVKSIDSISGVCSGITEYDGMYLVSIYENRNSGRIRFILFDTNFNEIREKIWTADTQNRNSWYPPNLQTWQDDTGLCKYENMNLLKVVNNNTAKPTYYMFMYYNNPEAVDVFSLSEPDLISDLDIKMIYRLKLDKGRGGFRMGGGLRILNQTDMVFFSIEKHIHSNTTINEYYFNSDYLGELGKGIKSNLY